MPDQKLRQCPGSDQHVAHPYGARDELWCPGLEHTLDHQLVDKASDYPPPRVVMPGVGKDAEIEVSENGAGQSKIPYAFQLIDGLALASMAAVLKEGADKYGADNWRMLPIEDHLGHLIMHAYAWLAGDRQDEHLSHIMCRATFAQGVDLQGGIMTQAEVDELHSHKR